MHMHDALAPLLLPLLLGAALAAGGCREATYAITEEMQHLTLGETTVGVAVYEASAPGWTYLVLHDDENTAVEAALGVIERQGGRLVALDHTGARNVSFTLADSAYTFDPNRIFTDAGAAATLTREGAYSDEARVAVRAFAEALLTSFGLAVGDVVITVHNNTEGRYSMHSYTDGGDYAADVQFVHVTADHDPDDFFFTTDLDLYNELRLAGFNVVLQDNALVTDDGSLSVYAGQEGMPYVNVEAQHGHFEEQVAMLDHLNRILQVWRDREGTTEGRFTRREPARAANP
jgi:hypothetical protein